jgi:hypothetical protein
MTMSMSYRRYFRIPNATETGRRHRRLEDHQDAVDREHGRDQDRRQRQPLQLEALLSSGATEPAHDRRGAHDHDGKYQRRGGDRRSSYTSASNADRIVDARIHRETRDHGGECRGHQADRDRRPHRPAPSRCQETPVREDRGDDGQAGDQGDPDPLDEPRRVDAPGRDPMSRVDRPARVLAGEREDPGQEPQAAEDPSDRVPGAKGSEDGTDAADDERPDDRVALGPELREPHRRIPGEHEEHCGAGRQDRRYHERSACQHSDG